LTDFEDMNAEKLKQLEAQVRIGGKVLWAISCKLSIICCEIIKNYCSKLIVAFRDFSQILFGCWCCPG